MRNQAIVGIFLILLGALLFVYWVLIPAKEKQKILNEIYNSSNYSTQQVKNANIYPIVQISNIHLKTKDSIVVLTQDYPIGTSLVTNVRNYPGFSMHTNLFQGAKSYVIYFPGCSDCDGVSVNINTSCDNCDVQIFINKQRISSGHISKFFTHFIPKELIKNKNSLKFILNPPSNPFIESTFTVNNITIKYTQKSEFIGNFYYYGGQVYLNYNFCPVSPQVVDFFINSKRVYFPSCSSSVYGSKLYLTPYLKEGINKIRVISEVPTKISLSLEYNSPKFFYFFRKPADGLIYLFISDGSGILKINNCTFPITSQTTVLDVKKCLMQYNELVIEAKPFLDINKIIIT